MPEEELTRLYEVMRSFDSARQPEDQMHLFPLNHLD